MDIDDTPPLSPLESARAILGEHFKNYVIIVQEYETPSSYEVTFSDPYAAHGLMDCANNYHQQYLNAGSGDPDVAWIWDDEDEEEED